MNYRHHFHAGNPADVLKHVVLLELLRLLTLKPTPLAYLESHAGAGAYRLDDAEAQRTGEWREGIGRLWAAATLPAEVARYRQAVQAWNADSGELRRYPGSPALAADALRAGDRLRLCESEASVADELRRRLAGHDARVQVDVGDGYRQALKAWLPPAERRGLVLVDPPYEAQAAEAQRILPALAAALARFATGVYAIWYPIKQRADSAPLLRGLAALPAKSALTLELWLRRPNSPLRLNGSGVAVLNPPWGLAEGAAGWLPALAGLLADGDGAGSRCHWLRPEAQGEAARDPRR